LLGVIVLPLTSPLEGQASKTGEFAAELSDEQRDIKTILLDMGRRMDRLADKLRATQPDDAKRLASAAEKIRSSRLDELLETISGLLKDASFLDALTKEDRALNELDELISLLEKSKFENENLEKELGEIEKLRRETGKLASKQETLLQKTRKFLEGLNAAKSIERLKNEVSELKAQQSALNQGKDPDKLDPEGSRADEESLEKAMQLARELLSGQEKANERQGSLSQENLPIPETRSFRDRVTDLLNKADQLVAGTEEARKAQGELGDLAKSKTSPKPASGKASEQKPGSGEGKPPAKDAAKDAAKDTAKDAAKDGSVQGDSAKDSTAKDSSAKNSTPRDSTAQDSTAKDSTAENSAGKGSSKDDKKDLPARVEEGPSALEVQRREAAQREAKARLGTLAQELSEKLDGLKSDLSKDPSRSDALKENIGKAAEEAKEALAGLKEGALELASEKGKETAQDLRKAQEELQGELRRMEEKNASETAGMVQDQGRLEKQASEGSAQTSSQAKSSLSQKAKSSLEKGAEALSKAAGSMKEAAESLQQGNRKGARESGAKAREELAKAVGALQEGKTGLGQRSPEEKANDLQKKVARKTEEAQKALEELQKKLRKKDAPRPALSEAGKSLSQAADAMRKSAEAGDKGDRSLAKKQGEEALDRLDRAAQKLEEDGLERLEKEPLKKEAKEQDELARLTRDLAKKAAQSSKGSQAGKQSEDLGQASESMDRAGQDLEKEAAESAEKEQEEALEKLKNSQEELRKEEERLAQLNREREMLSMVEELTKIKDAEERIHKETVTLNAGKEGQLSRVQKLKLKEKVDELIRSQGDLADQVDGLNAKTNAELARVFTFVLKNTSADMRQVRDSLKDLDTGTYTQFLQKEVIRDMERLLQALKNELAKKDQEQEPGPPGPPSKPRLVPVVAELRMLKDMQVEVNRGTRDLEDLKKASDGKLSEAWQKTLDRLLQKQGSVSRMTGDLAKDLEKAASEGNGEEESEGEAREKKEE
jgi:hypothetical protein